MASSEAPACNRNVRTATSGSGHWACPASKPLLGRVGELQTWAQNADFSPLWRPERRQGICLLTPHPRPGTGQRARALPPPCGSTVISPPWMPVGTATPCCVPCAQGETIIDWTVIDANGLVQDRWQGVVGDVVGVPLSVLDAAADNSALWGLYGAALHTGERQETDIELILPAGKGGWRRVTVVPVDDDTVTVLTRDITRERHFELALEQSRRTLRGLAPAPARARRASDPRISEPRLLGRSAALLFFGAGSRDHRQHASFRSARSRCRRASDDRVRLHPHGIVRAVAALVPAPCASWPAAWSSSPSDTWFSVISSITSPAPSRPLPSIPSSSSWLWRGAA